MAVNTRIVVEVISTKTGILELVVVTAVGMRSLAVVSRPGAAVNMAENLK